MHIFSGMWKSLHLHVPQSVERPVENGVEIGCGGAVLVVEDDDGIGAELGELHGLPCEPLVVDCGDQVTLVVFLPERCSISS